MNKYRIRVPMIALVLMLITQLVYLSVSTNTIAALRSTEETSSFDSMAEIASGKLGKRIDDLNTVATAACEVAPANRSGYHRIVRSASAASVGAERMIVLGQDDSFLPYNDRFDGPDGTSTTLLPSWELMKSAGLDKLFGIDAYKCWYFKIADLPADVRTSISALSTGDRKRVNSFLSLVNGKFVVWSSGGSYDVHCFITVVPDDLMGTLSDGGLMVSAVSASGGLLWSSEDGESAVSIQQWGVREGQWSTYSGSSEYENRAISASTRNFRCIVTLETGGENFGAELRYVYLIMFILIPIGSALAAYVMMRFVMKPFSRLAAEFSGQFTGKYEEIRGKRYGRRKRPSFAQGMLTVFAVSLIIPAILSGVYYAVRLSDFAGQTSRSYIADVAGDTTGKLDDKLDTAFLIANLLPSDPFAEYIDAGGRTAADTEEISNAVAFAKKGGIFRTVVVYDQYGHALSCVLENGQTVGADELEKYDIQAMLFFTDFFGGRAEPFAVTDASFADENGDRLSGIFRTIYRGREPIGYIGMFINRSVFDSVRAGVGYNYSITDKDGAIVYTDRGGVSESVVGELVETSRGSAAGEINAVNSDGGEYNVVLKPLANTDWNAEVYSSTRASRDSSSLVLMTNLFIVTLISILTFAIALFFTQRLMRPVRNMEHDLLLIAAGGGNEPVEYDRKDEISELVEAYNKMVARIEQLIEANASQRIRERDLLTMQMQVELRMLQQQINPHLLYNTLEFISYNARREGSTAAAEMAVALAKLFRYTTSMNEETVRFSAELEHVKNYINIHLMRFDYRFSAEYEVTDEALQCRVLKFILQPAVENAFKHGIHDMMSGAVVSIRACVEHQETEEGEEPRALLRLTVRDNGAGIRPSRLAELKRMIAEEQSCVDPPDPLCDRPRTDASDGIGIRNVVRRLRMYYGDKAQYTIKSEFTRGTEVEIVLPAEPM